MRATKAYRETFTEQAKKLVEQMTLEEKVYLMSGNIDIQNTSWDDLVKMLGDIANEDTHYNVTPYAAGGIDKYNLPPMLFADGPRGVVCGNGKATCFPVSMARGATFDPALEEEVGHAIGREVRGFGGNLFAGVCINLPYNPGWGRDRKSVV